MKKGDGSILLEKKRTGINSCPSYRYRAVSCGLDLSASCKQGNELSGGLLFYLKNPSFSRRILLVEGSWLEQFVALPYMPFLSFIAESLL